MARIRFVNQHYWPDTASTGQHLTDVAEHAARRGHEVRVLCSRPNDECPPSETRNGVRIERLGSTRFGRRRALGRLTDYATFHAAAATRVVGSSWPDIVVTLTTPPLLGLWGSLAGALGRTKHVTFLMDHHPDAEFESGMLARDSVVGRTLEGLYGWTLRTAWHNVALGPYQAQRVAARAVDPERISIVPIWSWADEIRPDDEASAALRAELGWGERFVVLYAGNAGWVHRFDELLEAATQLDRTDPEVLFAFVGGGPRKAEIECAVVERGLTNVRFHPAVERERVGSLLTAADAHFVSLRPEQVGVSVPGKLYGQLASGRPVLFVGPERCETAEDLVAAGAGRAFAIGQGEELARTIRAWRSDPERCRELGRSGRAWFLAHRERRGCCEAWCDLLEAVHAAPQPGGPIPRIG